MKINGRDIKFEYTMQAYADIADICPDGDLKRMAEIFGGVGSTRIHNTTRFIVALNKAYMDKNEPDGQALTEKEVLNLDPETFIILQREALATFNKDQEQTVKAVPKKK
jgi:hypothetical protein